jgi:hypothetical protein
VDHGPQFGRSPGQPLLRPPPSRARATRDRALQIGTHPHPIPPKPSSSSPLLSTLSHRVSFDQWLKGGYTFGAPRTGDARYANEVRRHPATRHFYDIRNANDLVPWVPRPRTLSPRTSAP